MNAVAHGSLIVKRVGTLVEYRDGTVDLMYWILDCKGFNPDEVIERHRAELIDMAKKAGSYQFKEEHERRSISTIQR